MSEEILQDFLIEALDIIEPLGEMLIKLENNPDDSDLLNEIFRVFHSVKGGASFLGIKTLVTICHKSENVLDKIKNKKILYSRYVATVMLQANDTIYNYMQTMCAGKEKPEPFNTHLLNVLDELVIENKRVSKVLDNTLDSPKPEHFKSIDKLKQEKLESKKNNIVKKQEHNKSISVSSNEFDFLLKNMEKDVSSDDNKTLKIFDDIDNKPNVITDELPYENTEINFNTKENLDKSPKPSKEKKSKLTLNSSTNDKENLIETLAPEEKTIQDIHSDNTTKLLNTPIKPVPIKPVPIDTSPTASKDRNPKPNKIYPTNTIRVDTTILDNAINIVGELSILKNKFLNSKDNLKNHDSIIMVEKLKNVVIQLQYSIMQIRLQPIKRLFNNFSRLINSLAKDLGKEVELEIIGGDTSIDKNIVDSLAEPFIHILKNAVDHGIESLSERQSKGKPKIGKIVIEARQKGTDILLSISDDGKGISAKEIRMKAISKGLLDEEQIEKLSDKDIFQLIMLPDLSTINSVNDISGRGIGMEVVKNTISKLNGSVEVNSIEGESTQILIRVPMTLTVLPALMFVCAGENYAISLNYVQEVFELKQEDIIYIQGKMIIKTRKGIISLFFLSDLLSENKNEKNNKNNKVIIVSIGNKEIGLVVNKIIGQEEIIVKPLEIILNKARNYVGATVTGKGDIALILNLPNITQQLLYNY